MLRLLIALLLMASPALAQNGPQYARAATEAAKTLEVQLEQIAASRGSLRLSEPPVAAPFSTIFNTNAVRQLPPPKNSDVTWLYQWLNVASTSYQKIVDFGVPGASQQAAVMENVRQNQTEFAIALEFLLLMSPLVTNTAVAVFETFPAAERNSPQRQAGYARMRAGYIGTVNATLTFLIGKPEPANAQRIAAALRDTTPDWLKVSDATSRATLLASLTQARQRHEDPRVRDDLVAIEQAVAAVK